MRELFILGASDPEMTQITALLQQEKKDFIYAKKDGERVHASNSYQANNSEEIPSNVGIIFIECEVSGITPKLYIDHHRPGDPGYDKGPEQFWEGASLGQLHTYLGVVPTEKSKVLAAMDHCFPGAIKGLCPGVNPKSVLRIKLEAVAEAFNCSIDEVKKEVGRFQEILLRVRAKTVQIGGQVVYEIEEDLGIGYSLPYLSAQIAAVLEEKAILLPKPREQDKIVLCGDADKETVKYFMETWGPKHGLNKIYGTPSRGHAGGY